MSGFPTRPTRAAFGPTRKDDGVAPDDARYYGAGHINLDLWQGAGMGIVVPRAVAFINLNGAAPALAWDTKAWDPNLVAAAPVFSRQAQGQFRLLYLATYPDETGAAMATALKGALVVIVLHLLWRTWRGYDWVAASGWTLLAISVTSTWLLAWYIVWPLPLALVARDRRLVVATLAVQALFIAHKTTPLFAQVS